MEITYMMIGADGRQYGPITLDQVKSWISEGRITQATSILRSDTNSWLPAAQYQELGLAQQPAPVPMASPVSPAVIAPTAPSNTAALERQLKSGAGWFFFIAVLSLVNSAAAASGSSWRFLIGLGITQIIDAFAGHISTGGTAVGLALDLAVVGIFATMGLFARKGHAWAFIVGMVLYALDCALVVALGIMVGMTDWLSIGFHVFALYCIFLGLRASNRLGAMRAGGTMPAQ